MVRKEESMCINLCFIACRYKSFKTFAEYLNYLEPFPWSSTEIWFAKTYPLGSEKNRSRKAWNVDWSEEYCMFAISRYRKNDRWFRWQLPIERWNRSPVGSTSYYWQGCSTRRILCSYSFRIWTSIISRSIKDMGFAGWAGAVDCCSILWKSFPQTEKRQFHNRKDRKPANNKVGARCYSDLYIWDWLTGCPETTNDKTMVSFSPVLKEIFSLTYKFTLETPYSINAYSVTRHLLFCLINCIYPSWEIYDLPILATDNINDQRYTKMQKCCRKDMKWAFRVLKCRFSVLGSEYFRWSRS